MQKILVPTDGSGESEKALTIARQIASAQDAELLLVRVVEPMTTSLTAGGGEVSADAFEQFSQAVDDEAEAAMSQLAAKIGSGVRVRTALLKGPVESALLDYEAEEKPDLVVMATHGRTGLARFALGSVTDRLIREGKVPVFVTRRSSEADAKIERALVMLDGSGAAEEALDVLRKLIGKPVRSILLYRVVRNSQDRGPAMTYLEGVAARLAAEGVETQCSVDIGEPRHDVERAAKDADFVVLCTHGRTGFDRLRHGSVAEYVMRHLEKPALMVRSSDT